MKNLLHFQKVISYTFIGMFLCISVMFLSSYIPWRKEKTTVDTLYTIMALLYYEKEDTNEYPIDIECFRHDNQFNVKNVLTDSWGNMFHYEVLDNGQDYLLISKGKDGIAFTEDDVNANQYR